MKVMRQCPLHGSDYLRMKMTPKTDGELECTLWCTKCFEENE